MGKLLTNRNFYSVLLAVVISFAFVALMVNGATTISSNINTGGTLTVSGDSTLTGDIFASTTMAVTGQTFFYNQMKLHNATSDPTADATGSIYYDSTNRVIRLYNGSDWLTVASSTDASGGLISADSVGVRLNTVATGYVALGTTTLPVVFPGGTADIVSSSTLLFLEATSTDSIPLVINGPNGGGHITDLFRAYRDPWVEVFALDSRGNASTTMLSTTANLIDALVISGFATTSGATGNMSTEGTLTVTGAQTFTGAGTFSTTLAVNGNTTLGDAIGDTVQALAGTFDVGGLASTTVSMDQNFATTTIGYNTEIGGGGYLGVGTTTSPFSAAVGIRGNVHIGGAATTTLSIHTDAATTGTCIQMVSSDGAMVRIYVLNADNALVVEAGLCSGGAS